MRRSWSYQFSTKERWAAAGFVYREEKGPYQAMFLKPHSHQEPIKHGDWVFLGDHQTLAEAKKAVKDYADKNGYVKAYPRTKWE